MNVENTQSQMRKGILEYCILGILHKGEAYPSEILEMLRAAQLLRRRRHRLSIIDAFKKFRTTHVPLGRIYIRPFRVNTIQLRPRAVNFSMSYQPLGSNYNKLFLLLLKIKSHE